MNLLCVLNIISAQDPISSFFRQSDPCFRTRKSPRCNTTLAQSFTPKSPNLANIEPGTYVFLFTPSSPNEAEALHECGGALAPNSAYDSDADTEIFIHGWLDGVCRTAWMRESKEQLFERARRCALSYNVILVDWTWGNTPDYYIASQNCKIVGEQVGFVINNIMRQKGIGPEKFHVIGHSFGAIAGGFTGRSVKGLRRITALDPSVAPYKNDPPDQRVTYRDAKIVDVIHSNSGNCFPLVNGDIRQLGHADFYPNGGTVQTSCFPYILISLLKEDFLYAIGSFVPQLCFHLQSIQYYKVSINPQGCEFVGVASDSYEEFLSRSPGNFKNGLAVMGMDYEIYHQQDGERRKYFLTTTNVCPYCDDSYLKNQKSSFNISCKA